MPFSQFFSTEKIENSASTCSSSSDTYQSFNS